jgi:hypothetical protein
MSRIKIVQKKIAALLPDNIKTSGYKKLNTVSQKNLVLNQELTNDLLLEYKNSTSKETKSNITIDLAFKKDEEIDRLSKEIKSYSVDIKINSKFLMDFIGLVKLRCMYYNDDIEVFTYYYNTNKLNCISWYAYIMTKYTYVSFPKIDNFILNTDVDIFSTCEISGIHFWRCLLSHNPKFILKILTTMNKDTKIIFDKIKHIEINTFAFENFQNDFDTTKQILDICKEKLFINDKYIYIFLKNGYIGVLLLILKYFPLYDLKISPKMMIMAIESGLNISLDFCLSKISKKVFTKNFDFFYLNCILFRNYFGLIKILSYFIKINNIDDTNKQNILSEYKNNIIPKLKLFLNLTPCILISDSEPYMTDIDKFKEINLSKEIFSVKAVRDKIIFLSLIYEVAQLNILDNESFDITNLMYLYMEFRDFDIEIDVKCIGIYLFSLIKYFYKNMTKEDDGFNLNFKVKIESEKKNICKIYISYIKKYYNSVKDYTDQNHSLLIYLLQNDETDDDIEYVDEKVNTEVKNLSKDDNSKILEKIESKDDTLLEESDIISESKSDTLEIWSELKSSSEIYFDDNSIYKKLYDKTFNNIGIIDGDKICINNTPKNIFLHSCKDKIERKYLFYKYFNVINEKKDDYHYFSFGIENSSNLVNFNKVIENRGSLRIKKYFIDGYMENINGIFEIFVIGKTCFHRFFNPRR